MVKIYKVKTTIPRTKEVNCFLVHAENVEEAISKNRTKNFITSVELFAKGEDGIYEVVAYD